MMGAGAPIDLLDGLFQAVQFQGFMADWATSALAAAAEFIRENVIGWTVKYGERAKGWMALVFLATLLALATESAFALQRRFNARVRIRAQKRSGRGSSGDAGERSGKKSKPNRSPLASMIGLEMSSLPGFSIITRISDLSAEMKRKRADKRDQKNKEKGAQPEATASPDAESESEEPEAPYLAPSLGPSYFLAAYITFTVFVVFEMMKPILAFAVDLSTTQYAWTALFFRDQPYGAALISMNGLRNFEIIASGLAWFSFFWITSIVTRLARASQLLDHPPNVDDSELRFTRKYFAIKGLIKPDETFSSWANITFILLAVFTAAGIPLILSERFAVSSAAFAVGLVVLNGWWFHLFLKGEKRGETEEDAAEDEAPPETPMPGFDAVLHTLEAQHGVAKPELSQEKRAVYPRLPSAEREQDKGGGNRSAASEESAAISALLAEFAAADDPLTLSPDVTAPLKELHKSCEAHSRSTALGDERELTGLYLAAPAESGKTSLGILAAVNHALKHATMVIFVAHSPGEAAKVHKRIQGKLNACTLRWTLSVRLADKDLVRDERDRSLPEIVVCDLNWIAGHLIHDQDRYKAMLGAVGLIIVDDIESYHGATTAHAQLVFARLNLALSRTIAARDAQRKVGFLALSGDLEPSVRASAGKLTKRRLEELKRDADSPLFGLIDQEREGLSVVYNLEDFVDRKGDPLALEAMIKACEAAKVPWAYCRAGVDRRTQSGDIRALNIPVDAANCRVERYSDAAVIFVVGRYTHVGGEIRRLAAAGHGFLARAIDGARTIAIIRVVDNDERMALELGNAKGSLDELMRRMPLRLAQTPPRQVIEAHLSAELHARSLESKEILDCFGREALLQTFDLAKAERIRIEIAQEISRDGRSFDELAELHGTAQAFMKSSDDEPQITYRGQEIRLLPPPFRSLESAKSASLPIVEHPSEERLYEINPHIARFVCHPGAILETREGPRVVIQEKRRKHEAGQRRLKIYVEPIDEGLISVPERELSYQLSEGSGGATRRIYFGAEPLEIKTARVRIHGVHRATRWIDPLTAETRTRHVYGDARYEPLAPDPAGSKDGPELSALILDLQGLGAGSSERARRHARTLLLATIRQCVGLAYLDLSRVADVSLMSPHGEGDEAQHLVFFDLIPEGSDAVSNLEREGLALLLRLSRLIIERVLRPQRIVNRYNDRPRSEEPPVAGAAPEPALSADEEIETRRLVLDFLNARLYAETATRRPTRDRDYPTHFELNAPGSESIGRAFITGSLGLTDLRWTRLSHRAGLKRAVRSIDVGFSQELIRELERAQQRRNRTLKDALEEAAKGAAHAKQGEASASADERAGRREGGEKLGLGRRIIAQIMRLFSFLRRRAAEDSEALLESDKASEERPREEARERHPRIIPARYHGFAEIPKDDRQLNPHVLEGLERAQYEALDASLGDCMEENFLFIEPLTTLLMQHIKREDERGSLEDEGNIEERLFVEVARLFGELISTSSRGDAEAKSSGGRDSGDGAQSATHHGDEHALAPPFEKLSLNEPGLMLRHGTASDLTAALALATVQRLFERSTGCFINTETMRVLGAIQIDGPGVSLGEDDAAEAIGSFRERHLTESGAATEQMKRRFRERPALYARDDEGLHLAIDLKHTRQLSLLSHEYLEGKWHFMPFREGGRRA